MLLLLLLLLLLQVSHRFLKKSRFALSTFFQKDAEYHHCKAKAQDKIEELSSWVGSLALTIENKAALSRVWSWQSWCKEKSAVSGAKKVHQYIRGGLPWPCFRSGVDGFAAKPQTDANTRARPWYKLWNTDESQIDLGWGKFSDADLQEVPLPDYDQFLALPLRFSTSTTVGVCGIHPRHASFASRRAYAVLMKIWTAILRFGFFPTQIESLLVSLIPKCIGGDRPVGLFPTLIRWLTKWVRYTVGEKWSQANRRPYFFGMRKASTEICAWRVGIFAEYAQAVGAGVCAALYDIVKAFEGIRHKQLLEHARRYDFPLVALRLLLASYALPRTIRVRNVAASTVRAVNTVVPGCPCADLMMRLAIMPLLDLLFDKFCLGVNLQQPISSVNIVVVVDDIQVLCYGDPVAAQDTLEEFSILLVSGLAEQGLEVDLSDRKLAVLTQDAASASKLKLSVRTACKWKGKAAGTAKSGSNARQTTRRLWRKARNLGVDFSLVERSTVVRAARFTAARQKALRLKRVRKAGAAVRHIATITKAGVNSMMLYGGAVTGFSVTQVAQARSIAHSGLCVRSGKRSATADFAFASPGCEIDPGIEANVAPVRAFVAAAWEHWVPRHIMARAFAHVKGLVDRKLNAGETPWPIVRGPAAAAYATLRRIAWTAERPFHWASRSGFPFSVLEASAADVALLFRRDVHDFLRLQAGERRDCYSSFRGAPLCEPIISLLRKKESESWTAEHKGMLRAVVADAFDSSGSCGLCGEQQNGAWHLWACLAIVSFIYNYDLLSEFLQCALRSAQVPFFSTGLLAHPALGYPMPLDHVLVSWEVETGHEPAFHAIGFGDGSGVDNRCHRTRRCGWAVVSAVVLHDLHRGSAGVTALAPLTGPWQEVHFAEVFSLLFFLRHVVVDEAGCATFFSDCSWVVDTFRKGRQAATDALAVGAGLWVQIFDQAVDVFGSGNLASLRVCKVKAHRSQRSFGNNAEEAFQWWGNRLADCAAKRAAKLHPSCQETLDTVHELSDVSTAVGSFLAKAGVWRIQRYGKKASDVINADDTPPAVPVARRRRPMLQHRSSYGGGRWRCARCFRSGVLWLVLSGTHAHSSAVPIFPGK